MITWDESKRVANIAKHGIDFADCEGLLDGPLVTFEDDRDDYGEQRLRSLALLHGVVLFVVWTPRGADTHLISVRKANRHERKNFSQSVGH